MDIDNDQGEGESSGDLLAQFQAQSNRDSVGDLMAQFQIPTDIPALDGSSSTPADAPPEQKLAAVEVPAISNADEYGLLPGHFDVHCVMSKRSVPNAPDSYQVKLRSGELQTVSLPHLKTLSFGQEALDQFHSDHDLLHLEDSDGHRLRTRDIPSSTTSSRTSSESRQSSIASSKDRGLSGSDSQKMRRSKRSTRARNTFAPFYRQGGDNNDNGASSSDDIISSTTSAPRRLRLRARQPALRSSRRQPVLLDSDSDNVDSKGIRFSTRPKKSLKKNLREKFEDDISEHEESSHEQKFFGARETFHFIPPEDPFRRRHILRCDVCKEHGDRGSKGVLVFCQGCTIAYHQVCLGARSTREHLVTKISDTQFILQCRRCLGVAHAKNAMSPHQGHCNECKGEGPMSKPLRKRLTPRQEQQLRQENNGKDPITPVDMARVNNVDSLLFRCLVCHRAAHFEHLPPLSDTTMSDLDIASLRFQEYSPLWKCLDCIQARGEIDAMVAWRPIDSRNYVTGYTADVMEEVDKEYLIKWKNMSYFRTDWMAGSWVWGVASPAMRRAFFRSLKNLHPHMTAEEAIPEDFLRVDIIFDARYSDNSNTSDQIHKGDLGQINEVVQAYVKFKGLPYEETVWEDPPDPNDSERWSDFKTAYEDWVWRDHIHTPDQKALSRHLSSIRKQNFKSSIVLNNQPETMTGGQMMDYQLEGLNWLYYMWFKRQNAILADEMGLGKTIQVIGLFAALIQHHKCWPFLVVVPNSTCPNWRKEIKQWAPSIRVVTYYGSSFSRKLSHDYEMFPGGNRDLRSHVVVASYETMNDNVSRRALSKVPWAGLVVDEGQRLKSDKSQVYDALSSIEFPFKLLLTGTPLQNNTRELFNILQFCDPSKNAEALDAEYGVLSKENIPELHNMIRPFFLRRTKGQVLTFLPPIVPIIVPLSMSVLQKKLYKSILAKNPLLIKAIFQRNDGQGVKQAERHNLNNLLMQLRKCLCHPFVYSSAIEERTSNPAVSHRQLVEAAGKFQLLQLMLPRLQQRGHRALIFSQFLENLDLIEEFLDGLGLQYRRLDGRMSSLEKQKQIDDYNASDSPYFAFLLSTRSGGIGINLASADTVIIMDPDFNPHQDIQALSRAHRIGQKNKVLVFQLVTRGSAEEKIMQIGKKKMVLDHVLIDRMVATEDDGRDLESVLRHGAQALFDDDDSGDIHYDPESIERLLDRSQEQHAQAPDQNSGDSQFSFARVWANDNQNMDGQLQDSEEDALPNSTVWEKILRERETAAAEEAKRKAETFGRGKRKRTNVDYTNNIEDVSPQKPRIDHGAESDAEFREEEAMAAESSSDTNDAGEGLEVEEIEPLPRKKVQPFQRVNPDDPRVIAASMDGNMDQAVLCYVCKETHPVGFCRLKLAGAEHCGLCGLAHYGKNRICPHLRSEIQTARILESLNQSNEAPELVKEAKKYVRGVRGHLQAQAKKDARIDAEKQSGALPNGHTDNMYPAPGPSEHDLPARSPQPPSSDPAHPHPSSVSMQQPFLPRQPRPYARGPSNTHSPHTSGPRAPGPSSASPDTPVIDLTDGRG